MDIELRRLPEIDVLDIIALMTHPRLRRHMPLLGSRFDESACRNFVEAKERAWREFGFGVWAFCVAGEFVGWGGLQDEDGDPDIAIVLHPDHWGLGPRIMDILLEKAFSEMNLPFVTILLPESRKNLRALSDLGFEREGEASTYGNTFMRFRLDKQNYGRNDRT